jgi:subtilisin family serine protease
LAGLTGAGIRIGVIDSGVDYNHPALGGGFGPGYKIAYGYDLVGTIIAYVGDDYEGSNTFPDDDPLDNCSASSHGTHVAGIVGGDTTNVMDANFKSPSRFTGVAPNAIMGAYRVFGCSARGTASGNY